MFRKIPMPEFLSSSGTLLNSHLGLILVNVAFQTGFLLVCALELYEDHPQELYESAVVDSNGRASAVLPADAAVRPPLAAWRP